MADNGTYLQYIPRNFSSASLTIIQRANVIIAEYEKQGLILTLRQLYYQFVSRDLLPNTDKSYNRLGQIVSDGRLAGLISWTAIEDRTRFLRGLKTYDEPADALRAASVGYKRDLWENQDYRPEVWIEKDALIGVIEGICAELRVDFFACRGYSSQSEQWRAGQRFANYVRKGQRPMVLHLGDHDPSGLDMTRDNRARLSMFAGVPIMVARLGLNADQIAQYKPPPNPAKLTDSRAAGYVAEYGDQSWELDALDPAVLRRLIRDSVMQLRNEEKWEAALEREAEDLRVIQSIIEEI